MQYMQIVQTRQIMQIGQKSVWDGSLGGLRHRAPYGATLITTFSAIFINNIIFEIIGPFCDVNFIYTYPGPARVISDIHNQS